MTLEGLLLLAFSGIVCGALIGFLARCYIENGKRDYFSMVIRTLYEVINFSAFHFFLPLLVLFSQKVRRNLIRAIITVNETNYVRSKKIKRKITEREKDSLANVLLTNVTRYELFTLSLGLARIYFANFKDFIVHIMRLTSKALRDKNLLSINIQDSFLRENNKQPYHEYNERLYLPNL